MGRVSGPADLVALVVEVGVANDWRLVELPNEIVTSGFDIKVQSPINMMMVHLTDTVRALVNGSESESWSKRAVNVETPF
jgi:hypothetical protein